MALWGSEFEAAKMVDMAEIWRGFAEDMRLFFCDHTFAS
jgi:haloacetate dehalogenase